MKVNSRRRSSNNSRCFHKFEIQPSLEGCLLNFYLPFFYKMVPGGIVRENNWTFYQKKSAVQFSTLLFNLSDISYIIIRMKNWNHNMNKQKFQSIREKIKLIYSNKSAANETKKRELRYFSYLNSLFTLKNPLLAFKFVLRLGTKEFFYGLNA